MKSIKGGKNCKPLCSIPPLRNNVQRSASRLGDGPAISGSRWRRLQIPWFPVLALTGLLVVTTCSPAPQTSETPAAVGEWREFQGTWTATGSRHGMHLGDDRRASIANFNGSLLLSGPSRPAVGFRAEAIVLSDSATGMVGRAVWTDERGDQVYSELRGEGAATGNKVVGTFFGGSGRYRSAAGTYEFSWRFVLESEDGTEQGQSVGLKGRVRVDSPQGTSSAGGPRS